MGTNCTQTFFFILFFSKETILKVFASNKRIKHTHTQAVTRTRIQKPTFPFFYGRARAILRYRPIREPSRLVESRRSRRLGTQEEEKRKSRENQRGFGSRQIHSHPHATKKWEEIL